MFMYRYTPSPFPPPLILISKQFPSESTFCCLQVNGQGEDDARLDDGMHIHIRTIAYGNTYHL